MTVHYSKANSAYAGGGPERAINMLNKNLDLDITDFATVDFSAVIEAVDLLGGIDIDLTDEEVKWLNAYLIETSQVTGVSYENVTVIRYAASLAVFRRWLTAGSVIRRAGITSVPSGSGWSWRKSLQAAKSTGRDRHLPSMIGTMIPYIKTSLSNTEMHCTCGQISENTAIADTQGFPYDQAGGGCGCG